MDASPDYGDKMIKINGLNKTFVKRGIKKEALKDVSLSIAENEFVAIMGPSGSGKSTLLNILGGLETVTGGEYFFREEAVHEMGTAARNQFRKEHVGFVFQDYKLLDDYSVYENVELPLRIRNMKAAERKKRTNEVLEKLHLGELAKKYPDFISGGEQQRCAIARALAGGNELLLADEPTGALDSENGRALMELFTELNSEQKVTIIMVTHDENIAGYAKRIIRLHDGEIVGG